MANKVLSFLNEKSHDFVEKMEELSLRCPHVLELIFEYLDNLSLVSCRLVNTTWNLIIQNGKQLGVRKIQHYIGSNCVLENLWNSIFEKAPQKIIKEFAFGVKKDKSSYGWMSLKGKFLCLFLSASFLSTNFYQIQSMDFRHKH